MRGKICVVALFGLLFSRPAFSQDSLIIRTYSGMDIAFSNRNALGNGSVPALRFPEGSQKTALRKLQFWISGLNGTDTFAVAADPFTTNTSWYPGPAAISGTRNHVAFGEWDHFFEVTASEISDHRKKYDDNGYQAPAGILRWPAAYSQNGFPVILAPFGDADQNGAYNPQNGDFPFVPGSVNLFAMASDSAGLLFPGANTSHLDQSICWFLPENPDMLPNTMFFRVTVCNRSSSSLDQLRLSAVADFGIGDPNDNFISTDVTNSAISGYNTQGTDPVYGNNWPAVSILWLSHPAGKSIYFENSADKVKGKPESAADFFHLSNGHWKTGKFLSFGSSGLDGNTPADFVYSNGTDPAQSYKDWDEAPGNAGRRTGLISTGVWTIGAGTCKVADGAVVLTTGAPDSAVLQNRLASVVNFYNQAEWTLQTKELSDRESPFRIYPNPVQRGSRIYLKGISGAEPVELYTVTGSLLRTVKMNSSDFKVDLPAGIYLLRSRSGAVARLQVVE